MKLAFTNFNIHYEFKKFCFLRNFKNQTVNIVSFIDRYGFADDSKKACNIRFHQQEDIKATAIIESS